MLTDKCKAIIDEAMTAGGDLTKLSAEAVAHIESCLECRKSLKAVEAIKASAVSVIPVASAAALRSKIASNLEASMEARRAMAGGKAAAKILFGTGSVVLGLIVGVAVTLGVLCLGNKNEASVDASRRNDVVEVSQVATSSSNVSVVSQTATSSSEVGDEVVESTEEKVADDSNIASSDGNTSMKSNEPPCEQAETTIPSVAEDNNQ